MFNTSIHNFQYLLEPVYIHSTYSYYNLCSYNRTHIKNYKSHLTFILKKYFICEDHYEDAMIESIIEKQKNYDETTRPNIALFLDDILTKDFKKSNYVSFLSTRFRHHGISMLCFTTQSFRAVSNLIRGNATDVIIMKQQSAKELEKIIEEYGQFYGEERFREKYDEVMQDKYQMLYLKLSENPAQLYKNFEERLI